MLSGGKVGIVLHRKTKEDLICIIDAVDYHLVKDYRWWSIQSNKTFYAQCNIIVDGKRTSTTIHRFILPSDQEVDHIDRNGLNNTRSNLRQATRLLNCANQGLKEANTSGYKGVHWVKRDNKWQTRIWINGKRKSLGYFDDVIKAAEAYDSAAFRLHGEYAVLNFPQTWDGRE